MPPNRLERYPMSTLEPNPRRRKTSNHKGLESITWNHKVYLSDGTILTDSQWNQLVKDGTLTIEDGRRIELDG